MNVVAQLIKTGIACCFVIVLWTGHAYSADEVVSFSKPEYKVLYQQLLREYRCLKCQNQNLADSNASLAGDLRREIRDQLESGSSQAQIEEYLVSRYGEFVLYRPRFSSKTLILWLGPFVLLLVGLVSLVAMVRGKTSERRYGELNEAGVSQAVEDANLPDADKLRRARDLLN